MKLRACDKLPGLDYVMCSNQRIIEEFERSGNAIMEVIDFPQKNAESCRSGLMYAAKTLTWDHIKVSVRRGHVYLINTWKIKK